MTAPVKTLLSAAFAVIAGTAISGESIYLKLSDQPNRSVRIIDTSSTELELDVKGDEALIQQSRQRGITYPFKVTNYKTQKFLTKTGPSANDGSFSLERTLEDVASYSEDRKGNRIAVPDSMKDMVGVVMKGVIESGGKMRIESLEGGNLDSGRRALVKSVAGSSFPVEQAPKAPLRIGDSFSTEMPIEMPIPGYAPIRVNVRSNYVLKQIEGDRAILAMKMSFELTSPPEGAHVSGDGNGSGTMEYNLKTQLQEKMHTRMKMAMRFQSGKLLVSSKLRSTSSVQQFLVPPGR